LGLDEDRRTRRGSLAIVVDQVVAVVVLSVADLRRGANCTLASPAGLGHWVAAHGSWTAFPNARATGDVEGSPELASVVYGAIAIVVDAIAADFRCSLNDLGITNRGLTVAGAHTMSRALTGTDTDGAGIALPKTLINDSVAIVVDTIAYLGRPGRTEAGNVTVQVYSQALPGIGADGLGGTAGIAGWRIWTLTAAPSIGASDLGGTAGIAGWRSWTLAAA
jgi:hypothetical protein